MVNSTVSRTGESFVSVRKLTHQQSAKYIFYGRSSQNSKYVKGQLELQIACENAKKISILDMLGEFEDFMISNH